MSTAAERVSEYLRQFAAVGCDTIDVLDDTTTEAALRASDLRELVRVAKRNAPTTTTEYAVRDHTAVEWNAQMDEEPDFRRRTYKTAWWAWPHMEEDEQQGTAEDMVVQLVGYRHRAEVVSRTVTAWEPARPAGD